MRSFALITFFLALTALPAVGQTAVEKANALFEAEDWAGAAKAYDAAWDSAEIPASLKVRVAIRGAVAHFRQGHGDRAFEWLGRAVESGLPVGFMDNLPVLAEMREDPRFAELRLVAERKSLPCKHEPIYRDFDFWIGSWDVYGQGGAKAGTNTIVRASEGCILYESWENTVGNDGHSINYVDPATEEWVQVWMGADGSLISGRGGFRDGAMRLLGEHVLKSGEKRPFRMTFTPNDDGSVRQFLEESTDDGKTFITWFDGRYVPAGSEPPASE